MLSFILVEAQDGGGGDIYFIKKWNRALWWIPDTSFSFFSLLLCFTCSAMCVIVRFLFILIFFQFFLSFDQNWKVIFSTRLIWLRFDSPVIGLMSVNPFPFLKILRSVDTEKSLIFQILLSKTTVFLFTYLNVVLSLNCYFHNSTLSV